jgi:N-acyl-D-aspartate/D-glutamate deacylase
VLGHYTRDEKVLELPEAIRKMTSLSAQVLGLHDRGLIAPGYVADLVVFDPAEIADLATFEQPHQEPAGIRTVLVNGVAVIRDGRPSGDTT